MARKTSNFVNRQIMMGLRCLACFFGSYIWPFRQYHVIQTHMSDFQQSGVLSMSSPSRFRLHKTVAMVGLMGAGKTAVGRALAAHLGVEFRDSDQEIERAADRSVPEIFARDGETFFRDKEAQVIARLVSSEPCILSTGGGAFMAERNRDVLASHGVALWIDADLELLWNRVKNKGTRPLLETADPKATLSKLFDDRRPVYALAELRVEADPEFSIAQMVERVVQVLLSRPDVLEDLGDV